MKENERTQSTIEGATDATSPTVDSFVLMLIKLFNWDTCYWALCTVRHTAETAA